MSLACLPSSFFLLAQQVYRYQYESTGLQRGIGGQGLYKKDQCVTE